MAIIQLRAIEGSYFFNDHYSSHSVFPIIFRSFICGIHPNFVPGFVSPLSAPATVACHTSISLSSAPFTSVSTHHPLLSRSSTSNPAADDTQIALPPPADATRVRRLDSHDSDVTQEAHPTYVAAWVCRHPPFLRSSDLRPTVIGPMSHRFVLVLCDSYVPCPLVVSHLRRSYHVSSTS